MIFFNLLEEGKLYPLQFKHIINSYGYKIYDEETKKIFDAIKKNEDCNIKSKEIITKS